MISITEYLEQVYEDFRAEIDTGKYLCNLKKLTFEAGSLPDYNNIQIQRLYLLRYAFAYAFEYTEMYKEVLQKMGDPGEISVVSVGCGTMIDYWALIRAIEKKRGIKCDVKYVGVDEIDWHYKIRRREQDEMRNYIGNAAPLFKNANQLASDVYFFPKSISEFSDGEIQTIADSFRNKEIVKDAIYLCVSVRENEMSMSRDIQRTRMLFDALQDNGYEADCDYNVYSYYKESKAIFLYDNEFYYPDGGVEYLSKLSNECITYVDEGTNCSNTCNYLNRQPVLKTGMIRYQVIKFERK